MREGAAMFHSSFSVLKPWEYLLSALICIQIEFALSQISITTIPLRPAVGETVLLVVDYKKEILNINWYRGRGTADNINILTHSPGSDFNPTPGPQYTGREKVMDNGTLQISNVMTNYSGAYTLQLTIQEDHLVETQELTVESGSGNEDNMPQETTMSIRNTFPSLLTTTKMIQHIGRTYYILPVLITTGVVIVSGILLIGVIICQKKKKKRSLKGTVYETEPGTERAMETSKSSRETRQPAVRWTPYPILQDHYPSEYQNSNVAVYEEVTYTNDSLVPNNAESAYTDLTYIHLSSDYQDFQRLNQLASP
ncbi:carcinoembryonic antigen-related cell adhesion molecule 5 [Xenopus laevis]|uniref:Immunoglobulin V-set domain-containing protein n=2 Tax=Xenopus laevis TaxID=8355 RepID=A0A974DTE0_XENLA|nr:carcinoembryonic antigen-related cell adhesion molecule 5 [Xenopus laevis]OCT97135.1 hypothetical protein XELAEV_18009358mg [Xenopus laevis]